jgi:hypothetical protein
VLPDVNDRTYIYAFETSSTNYITNNTFNGCTLSSDSS